jgi:predicted molibdopterin-dependent oxidoreductase YjgC
VSAPPVPSSADPGAPQFRRLKPRGGAIIRFTIDGAPAEARAGDLLMTAILLHRPSLRRFEFGEGERAGFCFMAACQDCWVSLASGRRLRACSTLVTEGMAVTTGTGHG